MKWKSRILILLLVLDQVMYLTQPIMIFGNFSIALLFTTTRDALSPNGSLGDALLSGVSLRAALLTYGSLSDALLLDGSLGIDRLIDGPLSYVLLLNGPMGKYAFWRYLISLSLLCLVFSLSSKRFSLIPRILKRFSILVYFKLRNRGQSVVI